MHSETRRSREIICDIHSSCEFFLCSIEHNFKKTAAFKSRRRAPFLSIIKSTINKNRPFRFDLTQQKRKCAIRPSLPSKEELALVHMDPPVVRGVCCADRTVLSRPQLASSWFSKTVCWPPLPLGFGLGGCLLLARRGRVCVQFIVVRVLLVFAANIDQEQPKPA